jgi:hypothetical protein
VAAEPELAGAADGAGAEHAASSRAAHAHTLSASGFDDVFTVDTTSS